MDLDKKEMYLVGGLVVFAFAYYFLIHNKPKALIQENSWDTSANQYEYKRTGYSKHYPINHDFWWCDAQNQDVGLSQTRWGGKY